MGFFNKKNERTSICGCNRTTETIRMAGTDNVSSRIKVLGSGCAKCKALERTVKEALAELGMETAVEHVTDFALIASYGIMTTPALVVDGKVVSYGKVLNKEEAKALILKRQEEVKASFDASPSFTAGCGTPAVFSDGINKKGY